MRGFRRTTLCTSDIKNMLLSSTRCSWHRTCRNQSHNSTIILSQVVSQNIVVVFCTLQEMHAYSYYIDSSGLLSISVNFRLDTYCNCSPSTESKIQIKTDMLPSLNAIIKNVGFAGILKVKWPSLNIVTGHWL